MSLITVSSLSKSFGPTDIFSGVSFSVAKGARMAIVGPNGIGKTTLLRILIGVDEALGSTSIDLFLVTLSVLWIITKMAFSRWDHQRTCSQCFESCVWKNVR